MNMSLSSHTKIQPSVLLVGGFSMPFEDLEKCLLLESDMHVPGFTYPLGLLTIAAVAREQYPDISYQILNINKELCFHYKNPDKTPLTIEQFIESALTALVKNPPMIVGVSQLFSTGHTSSLKLAEVIKRLWPKTLTVLGGHHVTNYTENIIRCPDVDYVIRGSGEISFTQLLGSVLSGKSPIGIPGVVSSIENKHSVSEPIHDINTLPRLAYDLLDMEAYMLYTGRTVRKDDTRSVSMQFSRGCVFKCTFCTSFTVHSRTIRTRDPALVIDEIKELVEKYKMNTIVIEDDLFGVDKQKFYLLVELLKSSGLKLRFSISNSLSIAILNEKMIDCLVEMGMEVAYISIESGSPYVQKHIINKNVNIKKAHRVAKYLQKADILLTGYFIYGFPGETVGMMMETVEVAKSLELDWAEMIIAAPLVGSTMLQQFYDKKILDSKKMEDVMNNADFRKRLFDTPEISAGDLEQFVYNANINVNFFNNSNMRHGRFARAISAFSGIISRYPFHIVGLACRAYCYKQIGEEELCSDDLHSIELQKERHSEAMCLYSVYGKEIDDLITKSSIISQVQ